MDLEAMLMDLSAKLPCLQCILRPEYAPYLNTAGTILLGWLIVSWMSYVIWTLFAPLTITTIAVILICPMTAKWFVQNVTPDLESFLNRSLEKIHMILSPAHLK